MRNGMGLLGDYLGFAISPQSPFAQFFQYLRILSDYGEVEKVSPPIFPPEVLLHIAVDGLPNMAPEFRIDAAWVIL
jgi:hypothetical protein